MSHAQLAFQSGEASLSVREFVVREAMSPVMEVRTQYGESDLAFVSRLLEEAGIAFTFVTERADGPDVVSTTRAALGSSNGC